MAYVKPILPTTIAPVAFESVAGLLNRLNEVAPATWSAQLGNLLNGLMTAHNAMSFTPGGTTIATTATSVKTVNALMYSIGGFAYTKAATDNFWAIGTGLNTTNGNWNGCWLGINAAGSAVLQYGTQATTQAGIVMPTPAATTCVVAYLTVNPTGTGNFVGGTTPLNDGTVVPNAAYYDLTFPGALTLFT